MIIHFIGQPGCGKTTVATQLVKFLDSSKLTGLSNPVLIDGDDVREIFKNKDYSEAGRRKNLENAYNIARFLDSKGFTPVLAMVSPFLDLREDLKMSAEVKEFYLKTTQTRGREEFFAKGYEAPVHDFIEINTDEPIDVCISKIFDSVLSKIVTPPSEQHS